MEREITEPVDVAFADGTLRRDAIGWARKPLHRCNLPRGLARVHAWSYWCITSREGAFTVLVADVGFAGVVLVSFLDFAWRRPVEHAVLLRGGLGSELPESPSWNFTLDTRRLRLVLHETRGALVFQGFAKPYLGDRIAFDLVVERPVDHETLNVLVPWRDDQFHFTSKQQALPARGLVRVGDRAYRFDRDHEGFACLDFGRGRRPKGIEWRWAFASSSRGGRTLGLNLGGTWTDGTGVTENGVVIDGRLHKIAEDVDFAFDARDFMRPWRITTRGSDRVDLRFVPRRERTVRAPLFFLGVELHQCVGAFHGSIVDDEGRRVAVDDAIGLAESMRAWW